MSLRGFFRNKWFLGGLLLKIVFIFWGGSSYFQDLFIPFLDSAITHPGANPWTLLPSHYFPYGSVLFTILFLPKFILASIFGTSALGFTSLSFFSLKAPLLIFDVLLLGILSSWAPQRENKLIFFYWLNPVLFYITYIHGQLDLFSMFFCVYAVFWLVREKTLFSALALAAGILCKFHVVILMPFLLAYIWNTQFKKKGMRDVALFVGVVFSMTLVGFMPQVLAHSASYISFGSPEALSIFGTQLRVDAERVLYVGFIFTAGVVARLCLSTRISSEALFYGVGIILGALVLSTSAMPGWYFWFLPFVAVFYATRRVVFHFLLAGFYVLYFLHFNFLGFFPAKLHGVLNNITFSMLQLSVLGFMITLWIAVIRFDAPLDRRTRPLLIGIAGDSGAGKNTMTDIIQNLLGKSASTVVEGDDYHRWERGHVQWRSLTHLHPQANFLEAMAGHTQALMTGRWVGQPQYDHSKGQFASPRILEATTNLIVQGLHSFYLVHLRNQFDVKIFMAPDENLRLAWKILRDVKERGQNFDEVVAAIRSRQEDSLQHIQPQRKMADWVVEYRLKSTSNLDLKSLSQPPEFTMAHVIWNDTPLAALLAAFEKIETAQIQVHASEESLDRIVVSMEGQLSVQQIQRISSASFKHVRHLTRSSSEPLWQENQAGFVQLIALVLIERQIILKGLS